MANKMINGKQSTIKWHITNLKLSHVDIKMVDKNIEWLNSIYGADMRISLEKITTVSGWTWITPYQDRKRRPWWIT
jgi:hypothetical protein